jgi:hypothetical protein
MYFAHSLTPLGGAMTDQETNLTETETDSEEVCANADAKIETIELPGFLTPAPETPKKNDSGEWHPRYPEEQRPAVVTPVAFETFLENEKKNT